MLRPNPQNQISTVPVRANEVRLQLSVLVYNLGNLWRRLVLPKRIDSWSLTSVQQRLVKTGGRLVKHARFYWLLLAESPSDQTSVRGDAPADLGAAEPDRLRVDRRNLGRNEARPERCPRNATEPRRFPPIPRWRRSRTAGFRALGGAR